MNLVSISKRAGRPSDPHPLRRIFGVILVDKFFLLGAAGGLFGSLVLGIWLWLTRSGLAAPPTSYPDLRELHAILQFYLFLTPFILGFLLQSTTRLLEITSPLPRVARLALPGTVIAAILLAIEPRSTAPRVIIAASVWSVALAVAAALKGAAWPARIRFGLFACVGLAALGGGVMLDFGAPSHGVLLFWWAIVPIILCTAQQFIAGALGGVRPAPASSLLTLILYFSAAILLGLGLQTEAAWRMAALPSCLTLIVFLCSTGAKVIVRRIKEPLAAAFAAANFWALAGAGLLAGGSQYSDAVLHLWGAGYAVTLIIGISIRLVGWLTDSTPLPDRAVVALILIWQIVPLARAVEPIMNVGGRLILPASLSAGVVMLIWAGALIRSIGLLLRQQLSMVSSATRQRGLENG